MRRTQHKQKRGLRAQLIALAAVALLGACDRSAGPYVFSESLVNVPPEAGFASQLPPEEGGGSGAERGRERAGASEVVVDDGWNGELRAALASAKAKKAPPLSGAPPRDGSGVGALTAYPDASAWSERDAVDYVRAVFQLNGVPVGDSGASVTDLYRAAYREGDVYHAPRPMVGDVVFFHNTWDRNRDGRWNDWYTLVGVVEGVDSDNTVSVLAYVGGAVRRLFLNVHHPSRLESETGRALNTPLRREQGPGDAPETLGTAARLFAGYANLLGEQSSFTVVDNWQPGMDLSRAAQ